jgi:mannan endo-1,4-beta-mannosidase
MKLTLPYFLLLLLFNTTINAQDLRFEAEKGTWTSGLRVATTKSGYSGTGYITQFTSASDKLTIPVTIPSDGMYDIFIGYSADSGDKIINVEINGIKSALQILRKNGGFYEEKFGTLNLKAADLQVIITPNWTWFHIDYVRFVKTEGGTTGFNIPLTPVNPEVTPITQNLYSFLRNNFGKKTISGVMTLKPLSNSTNEITWLKTNTGKEPALLGLDFMDHTGSNPPSWQNNPDLVKDAKTWTGKKGIVSICWHWRDPSHKTNAFYTKDTQFDITKINDTASDEYKAMIRDIDIVSEYLKQLQAANVPVLWRPLHEASGAWFWWGAKGAAPCIKLWQLMYDRMTNHHKLNNLIWVWTTTDDANALPWYPGDEYVDILGMDIYPGERQHGSQVIAFNKVKEIFGGKKIITLSENGSIPYPENMEQDGAWWSWFMPWYGTHTKDEKHNSVDDWKKILSSDFVITLDEMPDLTLYSSSSDRISEPLPGEDTMVFRQGNAFEVVIPSRYPGNFRVRLYCLSGKLQFDAFMLPGNQVSIPAGHLPKGIYLVQIQGEDLLKTVKVAI